jgi:hypothetical protein
MSNPSSSIGKNRIVDAVTTEEVDKSLDLKDRIGDDVVIQ